MTLHYSTQIIHKLALVSHISSHTVALNNNQTDSKNNQTDAQKFMNTETCVKHACSSDVMKPFPFAPAVFSGLRQSSGPWTAPDRIYPHVQVRPFTSKEMTHFRCLEIQRGREAASRAFLCLAPLLKRRRQTRSTHFLCRTFSLPHERPGTQMITLFR